MNNAKENYEYMQEQLTMLGKQASLVRRLNQKMTFDNLEDDV